MRKAHDPHLENRRRNTIDKKKARQRNKLELKTVKIEVSMTNEVRLFHPSAASRMSSTLAQYVDELNGNKFKNFTTNSDGVFLFQPMKSCRVEITHPDLRTIA